ncbi:L-idonate regulatory protein [Escherichia coli]|uniref:L-idonate regulatory protein n=1 Tax=Escherichia coli TaxID=562 RepID=A0A376MPN8_ECOLX|nr:L-idonate regulatory protein [Escherichia coli]
MTILRWVRFCCAASENLAVPEQIFHCGFSWLEIGRQMIPSLASVITPRFDIGRMAAQMLLSKIKITITTTTLLTSGIRFITQHALGYFLFITRILFAGRCLYSRQETGGYLMSEPLLIARTPDTECFYCREWLTVTG